MNSRDPIDEIVKQCENSTPAELLSLIAEATRHPKIYFFIRLLNQASVKNLNEDQNTKKHYELLKLFAFGTIETYKDSKEEYPELSQAQLDKLRVLSLLSLAVNNKKFCFEELSQFLDVNDSDEDYLESLVLRAIQHDLLKAKIDTNKKTVEVLYVISRDIDLSKTDEISRRLDHWIARCDENIARLYSEMNTLAVNTVERERNIAENVNNSGDLYFASVNDCKDLRPGHLAKAIIAAKNTRKKFSGPNADYEAPEYVSHEYLAEARRLKSKDYVNSSRKLRR